MNNLKTPLYLKNKLYEVVWDITYPFPCIIIDLKDLSEEALVEYNEADIFEKLPVQYFCHNDSEKLYFINILILVEFLNQI